MLYSLECRLPPENPSSLVVTQNQVTHSLSDVQECVTAADIVAFFVGVYLSSMAIKFFSLHQPPSFIHTYIRSPL